jgi:hypothetical protein
MQQVTQPKTRRLRVTSIKTQVDVNGNLLEIAEAGNYLQLKLFLASERRGRAIGLIHCPSREFRVERKRHRHLFKKFNAYGFNHYIMENAQRFDWVVLDDGYERWRVPREVILKHGQFLNFKNHGGFELQIFISLHQLAPYAVTRVGV